MKKILLLLLLVTIAAAPAVAYRPSKVVFNIEDKINDKDQLKAIKELFKAEYGVEEIEVFKGARRITVKYDADKITPAKMIDLLAQTRVRVINQKVTTIKAGALIEWQNENQSNMVGKTL